MTAAASNEYDGVEDLGPDALLAELTANDRVRREADLRQLQLAYQWCVLHPATEDTGTAWWGHPRLPGDLDTDESLGGEGTPKVAAFTPEPFAAALGVSTQTGMALLADALDLVHRLPRIWGRVQDLSVPAWKAQRVARSTHGLAREAAAHVDREIAPVLHTAGVARIERAVAHAIATVHPEEHAHREETGKETWDVQLLHPRPGEFAGTSELFARGDTLDLTKLFDLLCATAADLAAAGDPDPLGARKAKALGIIADHQPSLDLHRFVGTSPGFETAAERLPQPAGSTTTTKTRLYFHLDLADLDDPTRVGRVERLGPATMAKIRDWLATTNATIQPVLRMDRHDTVDAHDPPAWMRDLVTLRDPHCVFPWCQRTSRACDLDHIDPYQDDGPPGQTSPDNLAPLCRRHHRAKTSGRWRYQRHPDGTYQWTAPGGTTYFVTD